MCSITLEINQTKNLVWSASISNSSMVIKVWQLLLIQKKLWKKTLNQKLVNSKKN
jgi:hypothetical protein